MQGAPVWSLAEVVRSERELEPLPLAQGADDALTRVLSRRRTRREFGTRALTSEETGKLLWAGQGITSAEGKRTAPSAGAFHPIMLTVVDARGVARYWPDRHALERVSADDRRAELAAAAQQECVAEAASVIAITAAPELLYARYGRRAERYCALEAGHVAQNVLLMATALDLAAVPVGAFDDVAALDALELGTEHRVLYMVAVGPSAGPTR